MTSTQLTYQSNLIQHQHNERMAEETHRHNVASELHDASALAADTNIRLQQLAETQRSNRARENETYRANRANESLTHARNVITQAHNANLYATTVEKNRISDYEARTRRQQVENTDYWASMNYGLSENRLYMDAFATGIKSGTDLVSTALNAKKAVAGANRSLLSNY